VHKTTKLNKL